MPRVLIVDDSPTAREMLAAILQSDPEIEVVGFAINGREAVTKTRELRPDLITMDVDMPQWDGFEATKEIMIEMPTPIIIISSSLRAREVGISMQALEAGALTVLAKPAGLLKPGFQQQAAEIIRNVKALADVLVIRHRRKPPLSPPPSSWKPGPGKLPRRSIDVKCIAMVASTGGPPAIAQLLRGLPVDFPIPILLVQHIVSAFGEGFVRWLDSVVPLRVKMAADLEPLAGATVYVAPHDRHLGASKSGRIRLVDAPEIGGFRPAGDYLFSSVAAAFADQTIGIVLTGMGQDGVNGIRDIRAAGGITIAQDEQSCVIYGMPRAAVEQNLIDEVLALDQIPGYLQRLLSSRTG